MNNTVMSSNMEIIQNATYDYFINWTNMSFPLEDFDNNSLFLSDSHVRDVPLKSSLHLQGPSLLSIVSLTTLLGVLILSTVVGNLFVLTAILRERYLQTVSNYLVFSLAIADLMVACLVMPMGAQYEVMNQQWVLGATLCELWTSADVLCCTASILHLVAIAVDRFRAVTSIDYVQHRNTSRVGLTIALVWGVAFLVSFAPILGWKDDKFLYRIQEEKRCLLSQDIGYQIFATCATFYVPLVLILILYWRIYQVARRRIRRRPIRPATLLPLVSEGITSFNGSVKTDTPSKIKKRPRDTVESKREKKAGKTLVIITGVFVICWLPFFVMALLMALCTSCELHPRLFSLFLWLGYLNSTLNPLIYTHFNPDFRKAFARVIRGKRHPSARA
ncbi:5-hydroxytryptamine receptor 2B-like [Argiope bruennichi]|uniref:5-hydroxytryptamine receptor 2B-like n=1 Tax=Argiope bruennichi TaxID=94029 RepID=UPI002493D1B8|nr:5-hydroxytryptamine receptor 2B-like [Argiope bruennichi]